MPKVETTRVIYKDKEKSQDEFMVFANSDMVEKWRKDKTIPLVDVVQNFQVYDYNGGHTGLASQPTTSQLSSMFGVTDETEIIKKILEEGEIKSFAHNGIQPRDRKGAFGKGGNKESTTDYA